MGDATAIATWTFPVSNGTYEVATTWVSHANRATNATYIVEGTSVSVNQQADPASYDVDGALWQTLGEFTTTDGEITVTLSGDADGYVIADGVSVTPT